MGGSAYLEMTAKALITNLVTSVATTTNQPPEVVRQIAEGFEANGWAFLTGDTVKKLEPGIAAEIVRFTEPKPVAPAADPVAPPAA